MHRIVFRSAGLVAGCSGPRGDFPPLHRRCCCKFGVQELHKPGTAETGHRQCARRAVILPGHATHEVECSRAGCRSEPAWRVHWRNPKIHDPDRLKTWLSCGEHRAFFEDYLGQRGFPVTLEPFVKALS